MAQSGKNEGFRILDDFVCEAIPAPAVPPATPNKQGQNQGTQVLQDLVVDMLADMTEQKVSATGRDHHLVGEAVNGVLVIRSTDRQLDELEGEHLAELIQERGAKIILLNFSGVDFLSASFLASLVKLHRQVQSADGKIAVCNLGREIREVFSLLHLDRMFTVYSNQQQALQTE